MNTFSIYALVLLFIVYEAGFFTVRFILTNYFGKPKTKTDHIQYWTALVFWPLLVITWLTYSLINKHKKR